MGVNHALDTDPAFDGTAARKLPAAAEDRRRSQRQVRRTTAWLSNASGGSNGRTVTVEDLSLHGVGFVSDRACALGEKHWILITQGPMRLSTRVRIVSMRQTDEGQWMCGGEFF